MIKLENISKSYQYRKTSIDVFKGINLKIGKGDAFCIYGDSGSGKSTLLHIVGGMLMPSTGTIKVNSTELTALPLHFLSSFRRDTIGFVFQQFNLLKKFTVIENVLFPLIPTGKNLNQEKERIFLLLKRLGISHRAEFPVNHLSGGEQQRVAVARALALDPPVIIADEPFSNLDPKNIEIIMEIFMELKSQGKTFMVSSTAVDSRFDQGFIDQYTVCNVAE